LGVTGTIGWDGKPGMIGGMIAIIVFDWHKLPISCQSLPGLQEPGQVVPASLALDSIRDPRHLSSSELVESLQQAVPRNQPFPMMALLYCLFRS
jgi:hypothetical protein